jgi:hypothetical protein
MRLLPHWGEEMRNSNRTICSLAVLAALLASGAMSGLDAWHGLWGKAEAAGSGTGVHLEAEDGHSHEDQWASRVAPIQKDEDSSYLIEEGVTPAGFRWAVEGYRSAGMLCVDVTVSGLAGASSTCGLTEEGLDLNVAVTRVPEVGAIVVGVVGPGVDRVEVSSSAETAVPRPHNHGHSDVGWQVFAARLDDATTQIEVFAYPDEHGHRIEQTIGAVGEPPVSPSAIQQSSESHPRPR